MVAILVQKIDTEKFNHIYSQEFIAEIIGTTFDMKLEKIPYPAFETVYFSLDGTIKHCAITVNSYRLSFAVSEDVLMDMDERDFYRYLRDEIMHELKTKWWNNTTKIFLYSVSLMKSISSDNFSPILRAGLRFATLPENVCLETKEGVEKFLNILGINEFLKKYEPILVENPSICDYIKKNYRDYKDKVRLWQVLHGYSQ